MNDRSRPAKAAPEVIAATSTDDTKLVRCYRCPDGRDLRPGDRCPFCGAVAVVVDDPRAVEPAHTLWTRRCAESSCGGWFKSEHRDRKFCSQKCQKRHRRAELVRERAAGGTWDIGQPLVDLCGPVVPGAAHPVSRTAGRSR